LSPWPVIIIIVIIIVQEINNLVMPWNFYTYKSIHPSRLVASGSWSRYCLWYTEFQRCNQYNPLI
jgi:hypothetical protein